MTDVENKVVIMEFDNREFERNVSQSLKTIDKLNSELDNLGSSGQGLTAMSKAANNVDLSKLTQSAAECTKQFSLLEVVGYTAIAKITNGVMNFAGNKLAGIFRHTFGLIPGMLTKAFSQIKTGGESRAGNIEQAKFMLKGLEMDVDQITEDANYAVMGTAYGFDEAARAAASFGASGVKAGEEMKHALLGVSGVAAMTGRSYSDIANIFTTIAGNGKLMTMQLRQFSASGLNVAAALAKQMDTTEQAINQMVTNGEISFNEFADAMYEAFGEHAKDANTQFTGALGNMKAALSRVGESFIMPYHASMIETFNNMKEAINTLKKAMKPLYDDFELIATARGRWLAGLVKSITKMDMFSNVVYGVRNVVRSLVYILLTVKDAFVESFPAIKDVSYEFYKFTTYLVPTQDVLLGLKNVLKILFAPLKVLVDLLKFAGKIIVVIFKALGLVVGYLMELAATLKNVVDPFSELNKNTDIFDTLLNALIRVLAFFVGLIKNATEGIGDFARAMSASEGFQKMVSFFKDLGGVILSIAGGALAGLVTLFEKLFGLDADIPGLDKTNNKLEVLWAILKKVGEMFVKVVGMIVKYTGLAITAIASLVSWLGVGLYLAVTRVIEKIRGAKADSIIGKIASAIGKLKDAFKGLGKGKSGVTGFFDTLMGFIDAAKKPFMWIFDHMGDFGTRIKEAFNNLTASRVLIYAFSIVMIDLLRNLSKFVSKAGGILSAINGIGKGFTSLTKSVRNMVKVIDKRNMLLGMAIAMAVFTASVAALGYLPWENIKHGTEIMAGFLVTATVMLTWLSHLSTVNPEGVKAVSEALTSLGFAMAGFAVAVGVLSGMKIADLNSYIGGIIAMLVMIATSAGAIIVVSKYSGELKASVLGLVGFALSMLVFMNVFKAVVAAGVPVDKALYVLGAMTLIVMAIGRFGKVVEQTAEGTTKIKKFGIHIHTMTIGLGLIMLGIAAALPSVIALGKLPAEQAKAGLLAGAEILAGIAAFILIAGGVSMIFSKGLNAVADMFKGLSHAMVAMTVSLAIIAALTSKYDLAEPFAWLGGIVIYCVVLMGMLALIKESKLKGVAGLFKGIGAMFLSISISLAILSAVFAVLDHYAVDLPSVGAALGAIIVAIAILTGVVLYLGKLDKEQKGMGGTLAALAAMIFSITIFIGILSLLAADDPESLIISVISMVVLMAAIAAMIAFISKIKATSYLASVMKSLTVSIVAIFSVLTILTAIAAFTDNGSWAILVSMGSIVLIMMTLGSVIDHISKLGNMTKYASTAMRSLMALIISLGAILAAMTLIGTFGGTAALTSMSASTFAMVLLMAALTGVFKKVAELSNISKNAESAMKSLAIVIGVLGVVMFLLTAILVGNGPDSYAAAAVAAGSLSLLMMALLPVFDGVSKIRYSNDKSLKAAMLMVVGLAGVLTVLTWIANPQNAIVSAIALSAVMLALVPIFNSIGNVKASNTKSVIAIGAMVAGLALVMALLAAFSDPVHALASAVALDMVMLALVPVMQNISKVKSSKWQSVLAIGLIITALAGIVFLLATFTDVNKALAAAGVLALLMFGLAAMCATISKAKVTKETIVALLVMSAAIAVLGVIIAFMSSSLGDIGKALGAAGALAILMLALAATVLIIGKSKVNAASIIGFAVVAGSILLLAFALAELSKLDPSRLLASAAALSIMAVALGLVMLLVKDGEQAVMAGVGFLAISTGILILALAIKKLEDMDTAKMFIIVGVFAALSAVIIVWVGALALINDLCGVVVPVMLSFAVILGAVAVAMVAAGIAINLITMAIGAFVERMVALSNSMTDEEVERFGKFSAVLPKLALGLLACAGAVLAFGVACVALGAGIAIMAGLMAVSTLGLVAFSTGLIITGASALVAAVGVLALALAFAALIAVVFGPLLLMVAVMAELGNYVCEGFIKGITDKFQAIKDTIIGVFGWVIDAVKQIFDIHSPSEVFKWIGDMLTSGFIQGIIEKFPALEEVLGGLAETCYELSDEIAAAGDTWSAAADIGLQKLQEKFSNFNLDTSNIKNQLLGMFGLGGTGMSANDIIADYRIKDSAVAQAQAKERWKVEGYESAAAWDEAHKNNFLADLLGIDLDSLTEDMGDLGDVTDMTAGSLDGLGASAGGATNGTDQLKSSIEDALDIFTEFNTQTELTSKQVLRSFMSQLVGVRKWSSELQALTKRGLAKGMLAQLAQMGPDGYEKIHAFYTMTETELATFNVMYADKLGLQETTAQEIYDSFASAGVEVDEEMAKAIDENKDKVVGAMSNMGKAGVAALQQAMKYDDALRSVEEFKQGIEDTVKSSISLFEEVPEQEEISAEKMISNMKNQIKRIGQWSTNLKTLASRGINEGLLKELQDLGPEGSAKVEAFVKMTDEQLQHANSLFETSVHLPGYTADKLAQSYADAGMQAILGFTEAMDPDAAKDVMVALATNTLDALKGALDIHSPSRKMAEIGLNTIEGFREGASDRNLIDNCIRDISTTIVNGLTKFFNLKMFTQYGANVIHGIVEGIKSKQHLVTEAINNVAKSIPKALASTLKMHSPSVLLREMAEIGIAPAIAQGIYDSADQPVEAAERCADDVARAMQEGLASIYQNTDMDSDVITLSPVIDWEMMDEQMAMFGDRYSGQGIDISGNLANVNAASGRGSGNGVDQQILDALNRHNNNDVVTALEQMRMDILGLQTAIGGMAVNIDGASAGQILTPYVNSNLGRQYVADRRRQANG